MNPISGGTAPPAAARSDAAIHVFALAAHDAWPGLARAAAELGVPLDGETHNRFGRYRDLLLDRAAQFNLTAIRDPEQIERRLFLDALAMVPALDRVITSAAGSRQTPMQLIDIGTGAGFPGLALKIARPQLDVTLVDATAKKVAFLDEVIAALGLDDVRTSHGRVEELGQDAGFRAQFDVATARAVASLPVLLEYVVPLLKIGGTALLPKGLEIDEELRAGTRAASHLGAKIVSAADLAVGGTRLVMVEKSAPTPATYPRRVGIPSRSPLGERS